MSALRFLPWLQPRGYVVARELANQHVRIAGLVSPFSPSPIAGLTALWGWRDRHHELHSIHSLMPWLTPLQCSFCQLVGGNVMAMPRSLAAEQMGIEAGLGEAISEEDLARALHEFYPVGVIERSTSRRGLAWLTARANQDLTLHARSRSVGAFAAYVVRCVASSKRFREST